MVGCVQRQRTSQPLVEEKSCERADPSEVAGKSVSPRAAREPVTPTIITRMIPAMAPMGATMRMELRRYPCLRLSMWAVRVRAARSRSVLVR